MRRSLRARLMVALVATAVGSVALAAVASVDLVRRTAEDQARAELRLLAAAIAGTPTEELVVHQPIPLRGLRRLLAANGDELAVMLPAGRFAARISTPVGLQIARGADRDAVLGGEERTGSTRVGDEDYVYVFVPFAAQASDSSRAGVLVARPVRIARAVWAPAVGRIALAALAAVLAAAVASTLVARALSRPVRELSRAATRVSAGDLTQRVPVGSADELGDLARAFNEMTAGLAESQRREREFLASVSHELRTPITAIRGYAEALQEGALRSPAERAEALAIIASETDRLERMVRDVMDLARLGARDFRLEVRDADLAGALRDTAAAHRAAAAEAGVRIDAELPETLAARTDPDRVRQVVSNLIDNALRVTEPGGAVRVAAASSDGLVRIEVADTGPGIAEADLPHVFERSYLWRRVQGARPVGTGLGLAIVRELVSVLRGRIEVRSEQGNGTSFVVELPARIDA